MFQFHGLMLRHVITEKPSSYSLEAFHTVEFLFGIAAVAAVFRSTEVWLLWAGMSFHLCLDIYRISQWGRDKLRVRAFSFVEYWWMRKKMRLAGVDPETIFREAYSEISTEKNNLKKA